MREAYVCTNWVLLMRTLQCRNLTKTVSPRGDRGIRKRVSTLEGAYFTVHPRAGPAARRDSNTSERSKGEPDSGTILNASKDRSLEAVPSTILPTKRNGTRNTAETQSAIVRATAKFFSSQACLSKYSRTTRDSRSFPSGTTRDDDTGIGPAAMGAVTCTRCGMGAASRLGGAECVTSRLGSWFNGSLSFTLES